MEFKTKLLASLLCCFISCSKSQSNQNESSCPTLVQDINRCINIYDCQSIMNAINGNIINDTIKFELEKYSCGYHGRILKVYCPNKEIFSVSNVENLLPIDDCGEAESTTKIFNGERADLLEFPWQAALKFHRPRGLNPYLCGGSLINKRYVLTAAHCIISKLIGVRLGEYDFSTPTDCIEIKNVKICAPPHQDFDITPSNAIVHFKYERARCGYDIALIRLPKDAIFNNAVKPICLPVHQDLTPKSLRNLFVIGWGRTESGLGSTVLLKAAVQYQENNACVMPEPTKVYENQLCASISEGKDSCVGDSGGPIMTSMNVNGLLKTVQVGLVSFGSKHCGRTFSGVYTRLTSYRQWILDNINP